MNIGPYAEEKPPRRLETADGAILLAVPVSAAHSVSLGFWLRHGSEAEPPGWEGVSHFLEHIVFKGTRQLDAQALAREFDRLGTSLDAFTTKNHVAFTLRALPEYFPAAADLLLEMVLQPALATETIVLEQGVVCAEIQEAEDTPEDRLHDAFVAAIYGDHPRARPILGTADRVRALDAAAVAAAHRVVFAPRERVLVVAGRDAEAALPRLAERLAELAPPASRQLASVGPELSAEQLLAGVQRQPGRLLLQADLQQVYFELGCRGISYHDPDRIPLATLTLLMGGTMSSRLFQAVREREGLAYSIYTYTDMGRNTGLVSCAGSCAPARLERVLEIVLDEYRRLLRDGVGEDELENHRAQLKSQLIFSLEGVSNQMMRAARDEIMFGRCQTVRELVASVDAVTRDDLMRCAERFFAPDRLLLAVHGPVGAVPSVRE